MQPGGPLGSPTWFGATMLGATSNSTDSCASADTALVETFGWVGCAAAWLLFISPLPVMREIGRRGHVGDFSALPYLISTMQCGLWTVYALPMVTPCKIQPLVTNAVGCCLEFCYVCVFIRFTGAAARRSLLLRLLLVIGVVGGCSAFAIAAAKHLPIPSYPSGASRATTVLGFLCTFFNICMYASPLGVMHTVIKKRSVQAMPLSLTLGTGFCSGCWFVYALLVLDPFILVPNAAGLVLFAVQLLLYVRYCNSHGVEDEAPFVFGGADADDREAALVSPVADNK